MTIRPPLQLSQLNKANNTNNIVWTVLLVVALLFTQWAGLVHSVVHAGWQGPYVSTSKSSDFYADSIKNKQSSDVNASNVTSDGNVNSSGDNNDGSNSSDSNTASHSCTLFDALTLAATVHTPPYLPLLLPTERMAQLWVSYVSHIVRFVPHFCSRAPPSA